MQPAITTSKLFANKKVSALCFSKDLKYAAVALKESNSVQVYELPPRDELHLVDKWQLKLEAREQTQLICSLDWSVENKLLSCSHDKSVLIWNYNKNAVHK